MRPAGTLGAGTDRAGIVLAGVCAVHCLATPLAVALLPMTAALLEHPGLELPLVLLSIGTSALALARGCAVAHRRWSPLALFGLGAGLLLFGRDLEESLPAAARALVAAGAAAIIGAHIMNLIWCRRACTHPVLTGN
jgi:hypothetical protein